MKTLLILAAVLAAMLFATMNASAAAPPLPCMTQAHQQSFYGPITSLNVNITYITMVAVRTNTGCQFFTSYGSVGHGPGNCYFVQIRPDGVSVAHTLSGCASTVIRRVDIAYNVPAPAPAPVVVIQQPAPLPDRGCGPGCTLGLSNPK